MNRQAELPPTNRKKVLFIINTSTYFSGLVNVAELLRQDGRYTPVMIFDAPYPTLARDKQRCEALGLAFEDRDMISVRTAWPPIVKKTVMTLIGITRNKFLQALTRQLQDNAWITQCLDRVKPLLIILGGDTIAYDTGTYIAIGHRHGIRSLIIPQWMASPQEPAEYVFGDPDYQLTKWSNRIIGWLFPRWVYIHRGRPLLRLPGRWVLIKELFSLTPPLPWVLHSGQADMIALESRFMHEYCVSQGLEPKKIIITGSINNDRMIEGLAERQTIRQKIVRQFGWPLDSKLIVSAIPPDFLHLKGHHRNEEFTTYHEAVRFWVTSLLQCPGWKAVFSVHPSVTSEEANYIRQLGAAIMPEPIRDIIPAGDLFVACISSTIQWAIFCGIPVISYDVHKFRYHDYDAAKGVVSMETKKEFLNTLKQITQNQGMYHYLQGQQRIAKDNWGLHDGQSATRLLNCIDGLIEDRINS